MKVNKNNNSTSPQTIGPAGIIYEDNNAQFAPQSGGGGGGAGATIQNSMKRPASLDLNANNKNSGNKKQRLNQAAVPILETTDMQSLKFNTPDLEKFILSNNLLATPTPSVQQAVFPATKATTEQEDFSKGFVDALENLRKTENTQQQQQQSHIHSQSNAPPVVTVNTGMSGGSITYTNLDDNFPIAIKDEPQTTNIGSPPLSPIDMETQEKIKLERKRQRNRVAASKCRKRKLERISKLEDKVKILKGENADLGAVVKSLKEHIFQLKQEVIDHINSGCNISIHNVHNGSIMPK